MPFSLLGLNLTIGNSVVSPLPLTQAADAVSGQEANSDSYSSTVLARLGGAFPAAFNVNTRLQVRHGAFFLLGYPGRRAFLHQSFVWRFSTFVEWEGLVISECLRAHTWGPALVHIHVCESSSHPRPTIH